MNRFRQQVAIVTGAASGIGREVAFALAHQGATVVVTDLQRGAVDAVAAAIVNAGGSSVGVVLDVCDEEAVTACIDEIHRGHGRIDILISNAGIQIVHPIESFPYADWKRVLAVHLDGAFLTTKACLKHMYPAKSGSIVYMGSVHSKLASPLKSAYVAAKHGVLGLARTVAKEGARYSVRANVVCPGFVRTPLVDKQIPEQAKALGLSEADVVKTIMLKDTVDGEFTTLAEVADAVLFFADAKSTGVRVNL